MTASPPLLVAGCPDGVAAARAALAPTKQVLVVTHAGCPDGVAAAWVLKRRIPDAEVHFARERNFDLDDKMPDPTGRILYILDYSYPVETIRKLEGICTSVTLWDHHKTALEDLAALHGVEGDCALAGRSDVRLVYETKTLRIDVCLDKCATEIVCDRLWEERPWFVQHIRDRDLWLWEHPRSMAFSAALFERGLTFETFDWLAKLDSEEISSFYEEGDRLLAKVQRVVDAAVARAELVWFLVGGERYRVLMVNQSESQSETGHALCTKNLALEDEPARYADFAVVFRIAARSASQLLEDPDPPLYFSLRGAGTRPDGTSSPDLSAIARELGGGGHPNASGFSLRTSQFRDYFSVISE